jgi:hypothetical protein
MRKEINGLAAIAEQSFKLNPFSETLFVFRNRSRGLYHFNADSYSENPDTCLITGSWRSACPF